MSLFKCPICGAEIPENSKFCLECGEKIEIDEFEEDEIEEDEEDIEQEIDLKEENLNDTRQLDLDMKTKLNIFLRNRTTVIILFIAIAICIVSGGLLIYSNVNYSLGIKAINNEDYEKAVGYFEKSNKSGSNDMIDMVNTYEDALLDYKYKLYKNVYDKLSLIDEDFPKYKECQKLIDESKKYLIQEKLQEAKENYSNGEYIDAYDCLKVVLGYDKKQVDAVQLQYTYSEKAEEMKNKLAEEKRKADEEKAELERQKYEPQKIVDSNGKQIWKVYIAGGVFHFTGTYKGSGNFIAELSDSNQDLVEVIVNEIGDYVADKTVSVPYDGWYYLQVYGTDGNWTYNWD